MGLRRPFQMENMIREGTGQAPLDYGDFLSNRLATGDMTSPVTNRDLAVLAGQKGKLNPAQAFLAEMIERDPSNWAFPLATSGSPFANAPAIFQDALQKSEAQLRNEYVLGIGRERIEDTPAADYLGYLRRRIGSPSTRLGFGAAG